MDLLGILTAVVGPEWIRVAQHIRESILFLAI